MEQSSFDLSIVKKEPGLDEMCPSDSGIFDNVMSDEFHESSFHSMVSLPFIHTVVVRQCVEMALSVYDILLPVLSISTSFYLFSFSITVVRKYRWTGYPVFLMKSLPVLSKHSDTTVYQSTRVVVYTIAQYRNPTLWALMASVSIQWFLSQKNVPMNRCIAQQLLVLRSSNTNL